MEQKEYRIDYPGGEEPLLILPLSVGALVLSGAFFDWFADAAQMPADDIAVFRVLYWVAFLCCCGLAAWRLMRTIHATPAGLEYRFLGRTEKIIPWSDFCCVRCGRAWRQKVDTLCLIPVSCGMPPEEKYAWREFLTRNYAEIYRFHRTKNNILAFETYLGEVRK